MVLLTQCTAHHKAGTLDLKGGFTSTFASFIFCSICRYLWTFGPFWSDYIGFLRRLKFMPKIQHDIIIGSGTVAISAALEHL